MSIVYSKMMHIKKGGRDNQTFCRVVCFAASDFRMNAGCRDVSLLYSSQLLSRIINAFSGRLTFNFALKHEFSTITIHPLQFG